VPFTLSSFSRNDPVFDGQPPRVAAAATPRRHGGTAIGAPARQGPTDDFDRRQDLIIGIAPADPQRYGILGSAAPFWSADREAYRRDRALREFEVNSSPR
jgi:hypothetical protein